MHCLLNTLNKPHSCFRMKPLGTIIKEVHVSPAERQGIIDFYTLTIAEPDLTQYPPLTIFRRPEGDYEVHVIEDGSDFAKKQLPLCVNVSLIQVDKIYNHFVKEYSLAKTRSNIKPQSMQMILHGKSGTLELVEIRVASFFFVTSKSGLYSKPVEIEMCVVHNPNM